MLPPELPLLFDTAVPANTSACTWERLAAFASACTSFSETSVFALCGDVEKDAPSGQNDGANTRPLQPSYGGDDDIGAGQSRLVRGHHRVPVYRCMRGGVRSFLVGPFSSSVQQWHSIVATVPLLRRGDRIIRYTGDAVRASDATTPIAYPPLHLHHIHVHHPDGVGHWWETHGDYARADDKYDYSLASPPTGRCVVFDDDRPLRVYAQLNDVRYSTGTAMAGDGHGTDRDDGHSDDHNSSTLGGQHATGPRYGWFFRIAFEVEQASAPACEPVHKLALGYPIDAHVLHDHVARFDAGSRETVFLWTHRLPYGGTVAPPLYSHVHRARYAGHLLLRGEHTLDGLVGGANGQTLASLRASLPPSNRTAIVRQMAIDRARADGSLLCSDDPNEKTFVSRPEGGDGTGGFFDRRGRLECAPFAFAAGEVVTVLLFSRPLWATHLRVFPQHAQIFLFYTPLDGARTPIVSMVPIHGYPAGYTVTDLHGTRSLRCGLPPTDAPDGADLTALSGLSAEQMVECVAA